MASKDIKKNPLFRALGHKANTKAPKKVNSARPLTKSGPKPTKKDVKLQHNKLARALGVTKPIRDTKATKLQAKSDKKFERKRKGPETRVLGKPSRDGRPDQQLFFKNASKIPFLRVSNLDPAVTESDINHIMSQFGPIARIITTSKSSRFKESTVTAEIFYINDSNLERAQKELDNVLADKRRLSVTIQTSSSIIHSERLWKEILTDVAEIKNNMSRKSTYDPSFSSFGSH